MVAQVAVSLVLLIAGSMLIRSSIRAVKMDTGYDTKHVLSLELRFPEEKYSADRRLPWSASFAHGCRPCRAWLRLPAHARRMAVAFEPLQFRSMEKSRRPKIRGRSSTTRTFSRTTFRRWAFRCCSGRGFEAQAGQPEHPSFSANLLRNCCGRDRTRLAAACAWRPAGSSRVRDELASRWAERTK